MLIFSPAGLICQQAPGSLSSLGGMSAYEGKRVARIELQSPINLPAALLQGLLAQHEGEPFEKDKVQRTIEALYKTGRFSQVEAHAELGGRGGVRLTFVATENYFVGFLRVEGAPGPPSGAEVSNASQLRLGELLTPEALHAGMDRIQQLLRENGYFKAQLKVDSVPHPETQQEDLNIRITAGPRARVGRVTLEGLPQSSAVSAQNIARLHAGAEVSGARVTKALQQLRKRYTAEHRLEAQVAITSREYHEESNTLDFVLHVTPGPLVGVRLQGAKLSASKLKKLVPVYEENAVDEDLLNEGRRNLRDYFEIRGYFDVSVTWRESAGSGREQRDIVFYVELGKKHKLTNVDVDGNHYLPQDLIKARLLVQPSNVLQRQGRYSESDLALDVDSITSLYQSNGFAGVKVTDEVQDDYRGQVGRMRIVYHISEGAQTYFGDVRFLGNSKIKEAQLRNLVNAIAGEPFSPATVSNDRSSITNFYFNQGFPDVAVESEVAETTDPSHRGVTYRVTEGQQVFVDQVLISGLEFTRPYVVRREFHLWSGDPLSQLRQMETERSLYDLGLFTAVNLAVQNPEGDARQKNLLVQLEEARRYTFNYGLGFEVQTGFGITTCPGPSDSPTVRRCKAEVAANTNLGWSPRVSFDVSRLNFRGRNHTLTFTSSYGKLEQRASAGYEAPRWLDQPELKLSFRAYYDNSHEISTFKSQRLEGSVQVEQRWSRVTSTLYRFTYRRVKASEIEGCTTGTTTTSASCSNSPTLSLTEIPLLSEPVRVGMPSFSYIRDKRDNDLETTRGNFTTGDFGVAASVFGSQANFTRAFIQNSTYIPIRFAGGTWVLARSTQIGVEQPFGSGLDIAPPASSNTPCNPALNNGSNAGCNSIIPLAERFFAGGSNSLRSYPLNEAGPRDPVSGDPIGGGGLFVNMIELRMPPPLLPFVQQNLSFVLFEDAGNVIANAGDIGRSIIRFRQPHLDQCLAAAQANSTGTCDFNYLTHSVGVGVRYKTPIGPVRFDISYSLNPPYYAERDLICLPNETCPANQPSPYRRLGHLNFFFSVGQTF